MRFFLLSSCLFLISCNYNVNKGSQDGLQGQGLGSIAVLDYASMQKAIIGPQCLSCHSNTGGNKGNLNLETYQNIKQNLNQIYYRSIELADMPEGGMDPKSRDILKNWIENGAPMQATEGSGNLSGPVNWNLVKTKIIGYKCLECHSQPHPEGNLDLSNYETFKSKINTIFDVVFVKQTMPLAPYPTLTISEKTAVLKWISQGMPQ